MPDIQNRDTHPFGIISISDYRRTYNGITIREKKDGAVVIDHHMDVTKARAAELLAQLTRIEKSDKKSGFSRAEVKKARELLTTASLFEEPICILNGSITARTLPKLTEALIKGLDAAHKKEQEKCSMRLEDMMPKGMEKIPFDVPPPSKGIELKFDNSNEYPPFNTTPADNVIEPGFKLGFRDQQIGCTPDEYSIRLYLEESKGDMTVTATPIKESEPIFPQAFNFKDPSFFWNPGGLSF